METQTSELHFLKKLNYLFQYDNEFFYIYNFKVQLSLNDYVSISYVSSEGC